MIERRFPDDNCQHRGIQFHSITIFSRVLCYCANCDSFLWSNQIGISDSYWDALEAK